MSGRKAMLIDVSKCMGCRGCQVACKQWNQLPAEKTEFTGTYQNPPKLSGKTWTLISFNEVEGTAPEKPTEWLFRKQQCLHCGTAACLQVCPTGAIKRDENGIVHIDQAICTGCKYCVETCPFGTPHPDSQTGTARKCRMCIDRVSNGMRPACVTACPTGALEFGDREAMLDEARGRAAILQQQGRTANIYGEKELGGLGALYLLTDKASVFGLPEDPKLPHGKIAVKWLFGVIPGLAILFALWRRLQKNEMAQATTGGE